MKVMIIDNGSSYVNDISRMFDGSEVTIVPGSSIMIADIPQDTVVVLSGGHRLPVLWHDKYYANEINLIENYNGPILGICLGFELIAHVYGSHLSLLPQRVHMECEVIINDEGSRYFSLDRIIATERHRFALKICKEPLVSLGTSSTGIEIIRHTRKPIFGVQFHPEKLRNADGARFVSELVESLFIQRVDM